MNKYEWAELRANSSKCQYHRNCKFDFHQTWFGGTGVKSSIWLWWQFVQSLLLVRGGAKAKCYFSQNLLVMPKTQKCQSRLMSYLAQRLPIVSRCTLLILVMMSWILISTWGLDWCQYLPNRRFDFNETWFCGTRVKLSLWMWWQFVQSHFIHEGLG